MVVRVHCLRWRREEGVAMTMDGEVVEEAV